MQMAPGFFFFLRFPWSEMPIFKSVFKKINKAKKKNEH